MLASKWDKYNHTSPSGFIRILFIPHNPEKNGFHGFSNSQRPIQSQSRKLSNMTMQQQADIFKSLTLKKLIEASMGECVCLYTLPVSQTHHINSVKMKKNHTITSIDYEKVSKLNKIQHPFMIRALCKQNRRGSSFPGANNSGGVAFCCQAQSKTLPSHLFNTAKVTLVLTVS